MRLRAADNTRRERTLSREAASGKRTMIVGTLHVRLLIREARTLKDKRQVVKSIKDRLQNSFNVSIAEVGSLEHRQIAELGLAMVCNETHPIKTAFGKVVEALRSHPIAELIAHEMEV